MQNITIDTNVPIPTTKKSGQFMHLLREMKVGDSILVPDRTTAQVSSPIAIVSRERSSKFTSRKAEGGCRIWRIA